MSNQCVFCNSTENLKELKEKVVCTTCLKDIKKL